MQKKELLMLLSLLRLFFFSFYFIFLTLYHQITDTYKYINKKKRNWQNSLELLTSNYKPLESKRRKRTMRFWSPFHMHLLDIISDCPKKLIFRAPNSIRLRMTVDHIEPNQNPGTCLTQYNHDTCLWECYHSPSTFGHHRLFIWVLDTEHDRPWATAARFDTHVDEKNELVFYPITTNVFNTFRCQLIKPVNGILFKESFPTDILIRAPFIRDVQLQIDDQTIIQGKYLQNDIYEFQTPSILSEQIKEFVVMGVCFNNMFYSIIITYRIS